MENLAFVGMIGAAFGIGKLAGYRLVSYYTDKGQIKWVLMTLYLGSACSSLAFGFASHFLLLLLSRFFSGFFSNSQFSVRKLLQSLDIQLKDPSSNTGKKALLAFRTGGALAVAISAFLTNCSDFMPASSQFVQRKFLLIALLIFLLNLSGVLLIFSIESKGFVLLDEMQYAELDENKENKKVESECPDKQTVEKSEFVNYLQGSVLVNEIMASEESVGPEEVKFYSPRGQGIRELRVRNINSARPKHESSFNFPDAVVDTKEHEKPEGEGKRTHISFIEEELDNIVETSKPQPPPVFKGPEKEIKVGNLARFAFNFRVLLTAGVTFVNEALPVSVFLALGPNPYKVGAVMTSVFILGVGGYYILCEKIMNRYSISKQMIGFSGVLFGSLAVFPVFVIFGDESILVLFWVVWILCTEGISGFGNILLADSVRNVEREDAINRSNFFCILCRVFCMCLASVLVVVVKYQIGFGIFSIIFGVFYWAAGRARKLFPTISEVPYKV